MRSSTAGGQRTLQKEPLCAAVSQSCQHSPSEQLSSFKSQIETKMCFFKNFQVIEKGLQRLEEVLEVLRRQEEAELRGQPAADPSGRSTPIYALELFVLNIFMEVCRTFRLIRAAGGPFESGSLLFPCFLLACFPGTCF